MRFVTNDDATDRLIDDRLRVIDGLGRVRRYQVEAALKSRLTAGALPADEAGLQSLIDDCILNLVSSYDAAHRTRLPGDPIVGYEDF